MATIKQKSLCEELKEAIAQEMKKPTSERMMFLNPQKSKQKNQADKGELVYLNNMGEQCSYEEYQEEKEFWVLD